MGHALCMVVSYLSLSEELNILHFHDVPDMEFSGIRSQLISPSQQICPVPSYLQIVSFSFYSDYYSLRSIIPYSASSHCMKLVLAFHLGRWRYAPEDAKEWNRHVSAKHRTGAFDAMLALAKAWHTACLEGNYGNSNPSGSVLLSGACRGHDLRILPTRCR